ncbi:hypothetical protein HHK36_028384 [Tetracentron sinense]|uniref:Cytochrome P450 n=1 Tax=Tetracentron sinense TaxID=13715 RepID=A0A834YDA7_TETSI|nr:hypothetical protein HHK36_028384 [Tetracentron sinense]
MEAWFILTLSTLCICAILKSLLNLNKVRKLPPGPSPVPFFGNFSWRHKSFSNLEPILRSLRLKYGPILTLYTSSRPIIYIATHDLAHQALIQNGATFADRPRALGTASIATSNQHNISSGKYGSFWRLLRRNLTSEILHPSRVESYSHARNWVLQILINKLRSQSESGEAVDVMENFPYSMFGLLVLMCFGEKLDDKIIKQVETVQTDFLMNICRFNILNYWPRLGKLLFRKLWKELLEIRSNQVNALIPLIRARQELKKVKQDKRSGKEEDINICYLDTLLDLQVPDERRSLNDDEMVTLCSEFINAGTHTTNTAFQWIMANVVKHQDIQAKLFSEINGVVGSGDKVKEEDLQKMPYLKAVVLEGLRRHPPSHLLLPRAVTEDTSLHGYVVPRNAVVNFLVAEIGWDPKVWEDPMEFRPDRFLRSDGVDVVDLTGSKEIKMLPFGAGRRMCPGYGLAILHLEYFVANLIWEFEWKAMDGDDIDLSEIEMLEFTVGMKYPLKAHLSPRMNKGFLLEEPSPRLKGRKKTMKRTPKKTTIGSPKRKLAQASKKAAPPAKKSRKAVSSEEENTEDFLASSSSEDQEISEEEVEEETEAIYVSESEGDDDPSSSTGEESEAGKSSFILCPREETPRTSIHKSSGTKEESMRPREDSPQRPIHNSTRMSAFFEGIPSHQIDGILQNAPEFQSGSEVIGHLCASPWILCQESVPATLPIAPLTATPQIPPVASSPLVPSSLSLSRPLPTHQSSTLAAVQGSEWSSATPSATTLIGDYKIKPKLAPFAQLIFDHMATSLMDVPFELPISALYIWNQSAKSSSPCIRNL